MTHLPEIKQVYKPSTAKNLTESPAITNTINSLNMIRHIEGGYFVETDRDPLLIPSPFPNPETASATLDLVGGQRPGFDPKIRNASTSIFYLLTPQSPQGGFHRNLGRTIHTLHRGRGMYVLIHADEPDLPCGGKRVESFIVGQNLERGEKLQWIVEGGKFKASFLLDVEGQDGKEENEGLLISETVVPGFEYCDHEFLPGGEALANLVGEERAGELGWLLRPREE